MRRALLSLAASAAVIVGAVAIPSAASAAYVGPCHVGTNVPTLQPDPYGYTGGPRIGYSAGISCTQFGTLTANVYLQRWVGYWTTVDSRSATVFGAFVGVGGTHSNGCDGCTYRDVAYGQTPWGSAWDVSGNFTAP